MSYDEDIRRAIAVLRRGGVIVYPTDTIWGIGCDATNARAVERVYAVKRRADSKALLCLVDSAVRLQRYARDLSPVAWDLLTLNSVPTTVILDDIYGLAQNVYSADGSVGIRITNEAFSKQLCYTFQRPLVSTSANLSGMPSPQTFHDISDDILSAVDYVCESRRDDCTPHIASKVIKLDRHGVVTIIRQ